MKRKIIWLAAASTVYSSPHVFSVNDDLLAFPQVSMLFTQTVRSILIVETIVRSHFLRLLHTRQ